jgi:hypothetical protein
MTDQATGKAFARTVAAVKTARLPGIEESTSYGTPAVKVRGKLVARIKDRDTLVVRCTLDEKELLLEAAPDIYFETDHYKGWPWVLVRLAAIGERELAARLERAWRMQAPRRLIEIFDRMPSDAAAPVPKRRAAPRRKARAAPAPRSGTSRR